MITNKVENSISIILYEKIKRITAKRTKKKYNQTENNNKNLNAKLGIELRPLVSKSSITTTGLSHTCLHMSDKQMIVQMSVTHMEDQGL